MTSVGLAVVAMGWSWAVYLAQEALMSILSEVGEAIRVEESLDHNPFQERHLLVEGGPAPNVRPGVPLPFGYIDDYGLLTFGMRGQIDQSRIRRIMEEIKIGLTKRIVEISVSEQKLVAEKKRLRERLIAKCSDGASRAIAREYLQGNNRQWA